MVGAMSGIHSAAALSTRNPVKDFFARRQGTFSPRLSPAGISGDSLRVTTSRRYHVGTLIKAAHARIFRAWTITG